MTTMTCTPDILMFSGGYFHFETPGYSPFTIEDIAQGLSNCCRFAGQCREFYSVAQHSILVASIVPPEDRLAALLHDASEAFLGDITRPLKQLLPDYRAVEERVQRAIFDRFGVGEMPSSVKAADLVLLRTEQRDLMPPSEWGILNGIEPLRGSIVPMPPKAARSEFLRWFDLAEQGVGR